MAKRTKEYFRKNNAKVYAKHREFINRSRMKPCTDCGMQYNPWVMEFDHRDPKTKSFDITGSHHGMKRIVEELQKCDVVCANCHAERTHKQFMASKGPQLQGATI